jgi:hypothetical protein
MRVKWKFYVLLVVEVVEPMLPVRVPVQVA